MQGRAELLHADIHAVHCQLAVPPRTSAIVFLPHPKYPGEGLFLGDINPHPPLLLSLTLSRSRYATRSGKNVAYTIKFTSLP